jgi:hypothetical protein
VTPTCYTTNILVLGRVCQATKTILGRKKRGADLRLVEEGPIVGEQIPVVLIDGKEVDYQSLIKPQRVSGDWNSWQKNRLEWPKNECPIFFQGFPETG